MLICIIAGEPSGDALAARLMRSIRALNALETVNFCGVGGENMQKEGLQSLFDISDLSIMGLAEVIPSIPRVLRRIRETAEFIAEKKPDIVITVDSWSFSARVHKRLKKICPDIPRIHYVAPQVWAWKAGRAKTMHDYIDRLLTLFPNEPGYFLPYELQADCVGHSAIENPYLDASPDLFYEKHNIPKEKKIVLLLPGSRHNEVKRLLPVFLRAAALLDKKFDNLLFVLPTVKTVEKEVQNLLTMYGRKDVMVVHEAEDRSLAARAALTAMAASGTVSLELALMKLPHIVAYKVPLLTEIIAHLFVHVRFISLPNLILQSPLIPELIQEDCNPEYIASLLAEYLEGRDSANHLSFQSRAEKLRRLMGLGEVKPSIKAAEIIMEEIRKREEQQ